MKGSIFEEKLMKFIIEDCPFIYQVDWAMKNKIEDDTIEEYRPDLEESIEAYLELLENIFSREKVVAYKYPSWTRWHPVPRGALYSRLTNWP